MAGRFPLKLGPPAGAGNAETQAQIIKQTECGNWWARPVHHTAKPESRVTTERWTMDGESNSLAVNALNTDVQVFL